VSGGGVVVEGINHNSTCSFSSDFQFYTLAPTLGNGWALLGEPTKWISVSSRRFADLAQDTASLSVTLRGVVGEKVTVNWATPQNKVLQTSCTLGNTNTARMTVDIATSTVHCSL